MTSVHKDVVHERGRDDRTAPWFKAWTTWPSTLSDLLIAEDSAIRDGSFPVSYQDKTNSVLSQYHIYLLIDNLVILRTGQVYKVDLASHSFEERSYFSAVSARS